MKKKRTKENYPNQKIPIAGKVFPDTEKWSSALHWKLEITKSALLSNALDFAKANEQEFINFCTAIKIK